MTGIISPIKRKSLPEIAKVVAINSYQSLHHSKGTLKQKDAYKTKLELAASIITELRNFGFKIELVLADSLYGEASSFIATLNKYELPWVLAIRNNHGVWMPSNQSVRANRWYKFERIFSNQTSETRYIREIIFGKKKPRTYWEITTDPETLPENSTSFVMTNIQEKRSKMNQFQSFFPSG